MLVFCHSCVLVRFSQTKEISTKDTLHGRSSLLCADQPLDGVTQVTVISGHILANCSHSFIAHISASSLFLEKKLQIEGR